MEEHESYKRVVRILHDLENQYIAISDNKLPEKQAKLRNDINAHFDKIMAAINLRKVEILTDIDAEFGEQASKEENQRNLLQTSVEGCKKLLEAGTTLYSLMPQIAIETWNSARSLEQKHLSKQNIAIQYDSATSRSIATYGKVIITKSAIVSDFRAGTITTLAGSTQGFMDGLSGNARLSSPHDICYCSKDNCCYIADFGNNAIRRITSQGVVSTFFEDVAFRNPTGIIYYQMENCFIVTTKHNTIFRIYSNGTYDILAGSMQQGDKDGKREASFNFPIGITIDDESGDVFVADYQNHSIRKITQEGEVSTIAGSVQGSVDGVGSSALFNGPWGIHFNKERNSLFVGDYANNQIREISLVDGTVTTICNVSCPVRIISLPDNSLLALSHNQNQIISLTQKGGKWTTSCFAGSGKLGKIDGNAIECQFYHPLGITFDPKSHACVVVELSSLVRKVWCF